MSFFESAILFFFFKFFSFLIFYVGILLIKNNFNPMCIGYLQMHSTRTGGHPRRFDINFALS